MDPAYYRNPSVGELVFDPGKGTKHYEEWWAIVKADEGIVDLYCWFCRRQGIPVWPNKLWGPHISFLKGEKPEELSLWGQKRTIEFRYSNVVRLDNDRHAWLDVWSDDLIELRKKMGLPPKVKMSYHMTLGRLTP